MDLFVNERMFAPTIFTRKRRDNYYYLKNKDLVTLVSSSGLTQLENTEEFLNYTCSLREARKLSPIEKQIFGNAEHIRLVGRSRVIIHYRMKYDDEEFWRVLKKLDAKFHRSEFVVKNTGGHVEIIFERLPIASLFLIVRSEVHWVKNLIANLFIGTTIFGIMGMEIGKMIFEETGIVGGVAGMICGGVMGLIAHRS
jgi:hypothetical protein